jgi:hypothetical protein
MNEMKKIVWLNGLLAGLIVSAMLVISTWMCYHDENFKSSMLAGFGTMIVAFSTIFLAVMRIRDNYNRGVITFSKAFITGFYITLIASTIYVVVWLVAYYIFMPDFMDKYTAHVIREAKADGSTPQEISATIQEMNNYKEWYKNPVYVVLLTYMEILPVGLVMSIVSAFLVKRKLLRGTI